MKLLGYERINKYRYTLDVLIKETKGEYQLVIPEKPPSNLTSSDLDFVDLESYKKAEYRGDMVTLEVFKMNSDGREYLAVKPSKVRDNVVFRVIDSTDADFIARVDIELIVTRREKTADVPKVFITEEEGLFMEEDHYDEEYVRKVSFLHITPLTEGKNVTTDYFNREASQELKQEIVKESGDSEISLAVIQESENL